MILSEERIRSLLKHAEAKCAVPEGTGVLFEGSIAEGFGNEASDIDFLFVPERFENPSIMPTIFVAEGRRIEVRFRSAEQVRAEIEQVRRFGAADGPPIHGLLDDLLDRAQRFTAGLPLRNPELLRSLREALPVEDLAPIVHRWFQVKAEDAIWYAAAMLPLGEARQARNWAQTALLEGAKAWAAGHGELYIERKWVFRQLERAKCDASLRDRFRDLVTAAASEGAAFDLTPFFEVLDQFGTQRPRDGAESVVVRQRPEVTTWNFREHVHVARGKQDVFSFGPNAARVWKGIALDAPLARTLSALTQVPDAGRLVAQFQKLGLLELARPDGTPIKGGDELSIAPSTASPFITFDGLRRSPSGPEIQAVPVDAPRFATTGMSFIWENVLSDNAREDFVGAAESSQWPICEHRVREMARHACRMALCAYGLIPPPPLEEAAASLSWLPNVDSSMIALAERCESVRIRDRGEADRALRDVEGLVRAMRQLAGADAFPDCFRSEQDWQHTLHLGYEWVRMGTILQARFPQDRREAESLVVTKGKQAHIRE